MSPFWWLLWPLAVSARFSEPFYNFLVSNYGADYAAHLARADMGEAGSFGGGEAEGEARQHRPVVFVHGYMGSAGDFRRSIVPFLKARGFGDADLFATSYGAAGGGLARQTGMKCDYVKAVGVRGASGTSSRTTT